MIHKREKSFGMIAREMSEITGAPQVVSNLFMTLIDLHRILEKIKNGRSGFPVSIQSLNSPYDVLRLYNSRRLLAEYIYLVLTPDTELEKKSDFEKEELINQIEDLISDIDCAIQIPVYDACRIFKVPQLELDRLNKEEKLSYRNPLQCDHVYWEEVQDLFGKIDFSEDDDQMKYTFIENSQELKRYDRFKKTGSYEPDVAVINPLEWNCNPKKLKSYTYEEMYIETVAHLSTDSIFSIDRATIGFLIQFSAPPTGIYITHKHAQIIFGSCDVQLNIMRSTGCLSWQIYDKQFAYPWKQLQELIG